MASTTPNKETIRRISILNGATYCYILVDSKETHVHVLMDIDSEKVATVRDELESWCGMKFKVFHSTTKTKDSRRIIAEGEKILPITFEI